MTCRIKQLLSISFFALGIIFSNAAAAQQRCVQAVYLFRHAEDIGRNLAPVGLTHAALYPSMLPSLPPFLYPDNCPIGKVFAMWDRNGAGTNNPYQTAKDLAKNFDPTGKPEMFFTDVKDDITYTYYLCEYPTDKKCTDSASFNPHGRNALYTYPGATKAPIVDYLNNYLYGDGFASSVAIFFSSQGLPSLSTVFGVIPAVVNCPGYAMCISKTPPYKKCPLPVSEETSVCYGKDQPLLSWPGTARSSVDILFWNGTPEYVNSQTYHPVFINPPKSALDNQLKMTYVQCFNFDNSKSEHHKIVDGMYFCQNSGNIPNDAPTTPNTLKGKICGLDNIYKYMPQNEFIFGYCTD